MKVNAVLFFSNSRVIELMNRSQYTWDSTTARAVTRFSEYQMRPNICKPKIGGFVLAKEILIE